MALVRLTQSRINGLKPRKHTYELRDREIRGFGIRVLPSGVQRYFVHGQHQGERTWKVVGQAATMDLEQARSRARAPLAAIHHGACGSERPSETLFESAAEEVFRRYACYWKPSTLAINRFYLRKHILPYLGY